MSLYVLGAGGIGTLVGASVSTKLQVNFIARNLLKINHMAKVNNKIEIKQMFNNNKVETYKINSVVRTEDIKDETIKYLLVCVKTFDTLKSLQPILNKLNENSKVLLIQNGMGVVDELLTKVWPEPKGRPQLYMGVIGHGVWQEKDKSHTYDYNHAGYSSMKFAKIPTDGELADVKEDDVFIQSLCESDLDINYVSYEELLQVQVTKLMVNCCMNSVTSIIDCINGELKDIEPNRELFRAIIDEGLTTMVKSYPILDGKLETEEVLKLVEDMGFIVNGKNSSSMRQDTLHCRDVEIDYINGFIVSKAASMGHLAPVNQTIRLLVQTRLQINRNRQA